MAAIITAPTAAAQAGPEPEIPSKIEPTSTNMGIASSGYLARPA
ncbi:Uncharacterised protein [Bordetella pertussis]|nr:Uncharacterised protein [Bordetella pertussis]